MSFLGCENDPELYDFERYKFVSFINNQEAIIETAGNYEIFLRYDGSTLDEDFMVDLVLTGTAQEGVDYNTSAKTVLFKAGEIKSEPFAIEIIDNLLDGAEDLIIEIAIESVSNPNIDIGVGIVNQSNKSMVVSIIDNECSEDIDIFDTTLINDSGNTLTGTLNGNVLSLNGNIANYGAFPNANLDIALTPVSSGAKIGSVTFDDFDAGTDNDGWAYQFRQAGEGAYDICTGTIHVNFDVYYKSGGSWIYWYTSHNIITIL